MQYKSFISILTFELKLYFRDLTSTFFTFFLPIIFIIIFGGAFGSSVDANGYLGIDTVIATNVIFLIANNGTMGIAAIVSEIKSKQTLKRYNSIGISNLDYLIILCVLMFILSVLSFSIFYTIAYIFYGATSILAIPFTNLILFSLFSCLLLISFMLIGYIIALLFNSTKNAMLISSAVFLTMIFSSGVAIPTDSLPQLVQSLFQYTPMFIVINRLTELWCESTINISGLLKDSFLIIVIIIFLLFIFYVIQNKFSSGVQKSKTNLL